MVLEGLCPTSTCKADTDSHNPLPIAVVGGEGGLERAVGPGNRFMSREALTLQLCVSAAGTEIHCRVPRAWHADAKRTRGSVRPAKLEVVRAVCFFVQDVIIVVEQQLGGLV